jgi:hypothetical protein
MRRKESTHFFRFAIHLGPDAKLVALTVGHVALCIDRWVVAIISILGAERFVGRAVDRPTIE